MVKLNGVVFLAARTARSQAYAQAMEHAGLEPERVIAFGPEGQPRCGGPHGELPGLFLPDLSVPLERTVHGCGWAYEEVAAGSANDPAVLQRLRDAAPRVVIYSGYGGQIVGGEALGIARFVHAHAGWLPEERGSTTLYYGMLAARRCAVSVILLERHIDTGPILARREYPLPPAGVDADHLYDNAIRADLLVSVLAKLGSEGRMPELLPQASAGGESHYVIHPVLKHLALLSTGRKA